MCMTNIILVLNFVLGCTNLPQQLMPAVLRRFGPMLYMGPLNIEDKVKLVFKHLQKLGTSASRLDVKLILESHAAFMSGADIERAICQASKYATWKVLLAECFTDANLPGYCRNYGQCQKWHPLVHLPLKSAVDQEKFIKRATDDLVCLPAITGFDLANAFLREYSSIDKDQQYELENYLVEKGIISSHTVPMPIERRMKDMSWNILKKQRDSIHMDMALRRSNYNDMLKKEKEEKEEKRVTYFHHARV